MYIIPINNNVFRAGKVDFIRFSPDKISNYEEIKTMAKNAELDFLIYKNQESKYLKFHDSFIVTALKNLKEPPYFKQGSGCAIVKKSAPKEELSARIYDSILDAIKRLDEK